MYLLSVEDAFATFAYRLVIFFCNREGCMIAIGEGPADNRSFNANDMV